MSRYERFTFLCNKNERRLIAELAAQLQRSQSDAVRFVVMKAAQGVIAHERAIESLLFAHEYKKETPHVME